MSAWRATMFRELVTAFCTPLGWTVIALCAAVTGLVSGVAVIAPGSPASVRIAAAAAGWAMLLIAPALSARPTAEDRRSGLWELLSASPVDTVTMVLGRFGAGAVVLAAATLVALAGPYVALELSGRPDPGEALCAALGVWLAGCAYLASGALAGSIASSPTVAYLMAMVGWAVVLVGVRMVAPIVGGQWADALFALDPVRRLEQFVFGSLDSADIAYFVAVAVALLGAATGLQAAEAERSGRGARWHGIRRPLAMAAGCALAAAALAAAAHAPRARLSVDMTRTRDFALAAGDRQWLSSRPGGWRLTWVSAGRARDPALEAQVDAALAEVAGSLGGAGEVVSVDPTTGNGAVAYAQWFDALVQRQRGVAWPAGAAIESGLAELSGFAEWSRPAAASIDAQARALAEDDQLRPRLQTLASALAECAVAQPALDASVRALRDGSAGRPVPDPSSAAALLARSHGEWCAQLSAAAAAIMQRVRDPAAGTAMAESLASVGRQLEHRAAQLRAAQDALDSLPPDPLGGLPSALAQGGVLVIEAPRGVAALSARELLGSDADREETLRTDRRGRIALRALSAMRALESGVRAAAVLAHADERSLLEGTGDGSDALALADTLRGARIDVAEWRAGEGPRPPAGPGTVWVVIPPRRTTLAPGRRERALLQAVEALVAQGEPVLLSIGPSLLPLSGQEDPWARVAAVAGVQARTDRVIVDEVPVAQGLREVVLRIPADGRDATAVGAAIGSSRAGMLSPVPLEAGGAPVLVAAPVPVRRVVSDWRPLVAGDALPPGGGEAPAGELVVASAAERPTADGRRARAVVVGSAQWMRTAAMDAVQRLGGSRDVLVDPGNRVLASASVLWLAGLDDRVAGERTVEDVARVGPLEMRERLAWTFILGIACPAALAGTGAAIGWRRSRR